MTEEEERACLDDCEPVTGRHLCCCLACVPGCGSESVTWSRGSLEEQRLWRVQRERGTKRRNLSDIVKHLVIESILSTFY